MLVLVGLIIIRPVVCFDFLTWLAVVFVADVTSGQKFTRYMDVVSEKMPLTENFIQESLRLVQQSITLRKVPLLHSLSDLFIVHTQDP